MISPDTLKEIEVIKNSERQKVILVENAEGKKYLKRTISGDRREVYKVLSKINHTNIPKIHYVGLDDETVVIEEYIDGISLYDFIEKEKISKKKIISISKQVLSAMDELHKFNIIHRDIKPENILIDKSNHIWLVDYDIARIYRPEVRKDTESMGTFGYAPIEQYGMMPTDFKTDIYAFGVTLKGLLASSGIKGYPIKIAEKCTRLDPQQRYKSAKAVKKAIALAEKKWLLVFGLIAIAAIVAMCCVLAGGASAPDTKEALKQSPDPVSAAPAKDTDYPAEENEEYTTQTPTPQESTPQETVEEDYEGVFADFADGSKEAEYKNYNMYSTVCIFTSRTPMEHIIFIEDMAKTGRLKLGKDSTIIDAEFSLKNGVLSVSLNDRKGHTFSKTFQYSGQYPYAKNCTTNINKNADIICYDFDADGATELLLGISEGTLGVVEKQVYSYFNYSMAWCIKYDKNGFALCEGDMFSKGASFQINHTRFNVYWENIGDPTGYRLDGNALVACY